MEQIISELMKMFPLMNAYLAGGIFIFARLYGSQGFEIVRSSSNQKRQRSNRCVGVGFGNRLVSRQIAEHQFGKSKTMENFVRRQSKNLEITRNLECRSRGNRCFEIARLKNTKIKNKQISTRSFKKFSKNFQKNFEISRGNCDFVTFKLAKTL